MGPETIPLEYYLGLINPEFHSFGDRKSCRQTLFFCLSLGGFHILSGLRVPLIVTLP